MPRTILFAEFHNENSAKTLAKNNLSSLKNRGISYVGLELACTNSLRQEISSLKKILEEIDLFSGKHLLPRLYFWNEFAALKQGYDSYHELLQLLIKVEALGMTYQGLDMATSSARFANDTANSEVIQKLVSPQAMAQRDQQIATQLVEKFKQNQHGINIVGRDHLPGIQKFLIQELGKDTVQANFLFIIPESPRDYYHYTYNQDFIRFADACPLMPFKILLGSDQQKTFLNILDNEQLLQDASVQNQPKSKSTDYCCGLGKFLCSFFKEAVPQHVTDDTSKLLPNKKLN